MSTLAEIAQKSAAANPENDRMSFEQVAEMVGKLTPMEGNGRDKLWAMRYPLISLEFLRMRDAKGFPRFAVFCPESSRFSLHSEGIDAWSYRDHGYRWIAPSIVRHYFADVNRTLRKQAKGRSTLWNRKELIISQTFNGLIPDKLRDEMRQCGKAMPGRPLIVADAGEWVVSETSQPRLSGVDPLVIQFDYARPEQAWLIGHFDITPTEDYVRREFAL